MTEPKPRRWDLDARVHGVGEDPDPRFTLANERTFLAWIRTALALAAAGVGLRNLASPFPGRSAVAIVLVALGVAVCLRAYHRWLRIELALRERRSLPTPVFAPVLAYGLAAISVVTLVVVVLDHR